MRILTDEEQALVDSLKARLDEAEEEVTQVGDHISFVFVLDTGCYGDWSKATLIFKLASAENT